MKKMDGGIKSPIKQVKTALRRLRRRRAGVSLPKSKSRKEEELITYE